MAHDRRNHLIRPQEDLDDSQEANHSEGLLQHRHELGIVRPRCWAAPLLLVPVSVLVLLQRFPRQNGAATGIRSANAVDWLPLVERDEESGNRSGEVDKNASIEQVVSYVGKDIVVVTGWKMVSGHVNVRKSKDLEADILVSKPSCAVSFGNEESNWIKLTHEPGYMCIVNSAMRFLSKTRVKFQKIISGTCSDIKMFPVLDQYACQTAALAFGLGGFTEVETMISREAGQPEGCFWEADTLSLWLALLPSNKGNGAIGARHPICWDQSPCYSGLNCLVQTAFGPQYTSLSNTYTLPNKIRYAGVFGYRVIISQQPTSAELISKEFGDCFLGVNLNELDIQTVVKVCSIMKGFRNGCQTVMWTDADAAILSDTPFDFWMTENPTANVYWSVSDIGAKEKCFGWNSPTGCHAYQDFVSCLNAGAVIFRNTYWTDHFLYRVLARSQHLSDSFCNTAPFNARAFDQCSLPGAPDSGDQCAITCEVMADPKVMEQFECLSDRMSPVFQAAALSRDWMHLMRKDVFIGNCILRDKLECIKALVDLGRLK